MRAFIRFDKHQDHRRVVSSNFAGDNSRPSLCQREPMRIHKSRSVEMPRAERRQIVAFSSHLQSEPGKSAGVTYEEKV